MTILGLAESFKQWTGQAQPGPTVTLFDGLFLVRINFPACGYSKQLMQIHN